MDLNLFEQKKFFLHLVREKLGQVSIDYRDIPSHTDQSQQKSSPHLKAAVVLLLHFKKMPDGRSEYHFLLIKRSNKVSQGGDISCPGGMLQPQKDNFLSFLLKKGIVPVMTGKTKQIQNVDAANAALIHLFLTTALREAWEEIGLNPFNTKFLGALPPYPLTMFARTIFPLVCTTRKPFTFKTNFEVEKIIEIPLSYFFDSSHYAMLDIQTSLGEDSPPLQYQTPCLVIPDAKGQNDILWGATFNIIQNFLRILTDHTLPEFNISKTLSKVLTSHYLSPKAKSREQIED